ncbi:MAG: hypothetical protein H7X75_04530 [Burkholderiaceae bacterium]|nr:hypothetical protein [Burkholderiaceae bacterium]
MSRSPRVGSLMLLPFTGYANDPEIYREVVREFPGRVASIYIRSVSAGPARCAEMGRIADQVSAAGSSMVLVTDSETPAIHEVGSGRIHPDRVGQVRLDEDAEKQLPPYVDAAPN